METILHTKIISWTKEKNYHLCKAKAQTGVCTRKDHLRGHKPNPQYYINPHKSKTYVQELHHRLALFTFAGYLCDWDWCALLLKTVLRRLKGRMPCLTFADLHSHLAGSGSECQMYFQKNVCFGLLLMQSLPSANKSSLSVYEQGAVAFHSCTQNVEVCCNIRHGPFGFCAVFAFLVLLVFPSWCM